MADYTEKLNLKKPEQTDFYNIDDFNENFQKIDEFAKRKDNPHGVTAKQTGAVALNDNIVVGTYENQSYEGGIRFGIRYTEHNVPMVGMGTQRGSNSLIITSGCDYTNSAMENEIGQRGYYFPINIDNTYTSIPTALRVSDQDGKVYVVKSSAGKRHYSKNEIIPMSEYEVLHTGNISNLTPFKVITGSYVGTGTNGKNNPNSITFDFEPKLVILQGYGTATMIRGASEAVYYTTTNHHLILTWSGNVLSWYCSDNATRQFNASGETYHWVAIG